MLPLWLRDRRGWGRPCSSKYSVSLLCSSCAVPGRGKLYEEGILPVFVCAHMRRVASLGDNSCLWPLCTIGIQLVAAVSLIIVLALAALKAGVGLCAYTNSLARLDEGDFWTNAKSSAHNLWNSVSEKLGSVSSIGKRGGSYHVQHTMGNAARPIHR